VTPVAGGDSSARNSAPPAIFLMGTIGAGKTTLGRALARALDARHIEGDDFHRPPRPWFATSLSTCRNVTEAVLAAGREGRPAIISYPLRCREWIFYRRRLADAGVPTVFVTLSASQEVLLAGDRGRTFSAEERLRIAEMHRQGYARRPFADLAVRTDTGSVEDALGRLVAGLRELGFLDDPLD
jgi:hypothetical protein